MKEKFGAGKHFREVAIDIESVRAEGADESRTVEISFSSETPVERWYGIEVLVHQKKAVRLGRMQDGGAVLVDHRTPDHVGVVERVWIENGRGKAVIRFGKSARASEIWQDVVDGIRRFISVGYWVHAWEESKKDGITTYRITDWEPLEISIVAVPADASVGVGRAAEDSTEEDSAGNDTRERKGNQMTVEVVDRGVNPPPAPLDEGAIRRSAASAERERVRVILELGARFQRMTEAQEYVEKGSTAEEFRTWLLDQVGTGSAPQPSTPTDGGVRQLGLTDKERKRFSFFRLVNFLHTRSQSAEREAAFELEACDAWAKETDREPHDRGAVIPPDILYGGGGFLRTPGIIRERPAFGATGQRLVSDTGEGADMTPVVHDGASFIDLLRAATPVTSNAMMLTGLSGDVRIPKQTGGAAASFGAESGALSEQTATFGQILFTPHRLGAFTEVTRRAIIQFTPAIEDLLRLDLLIAIAQKLEQVAIEGGGANEPTGILGTGGVGDVNIATDGGALTWAKVVEFETLVDTANALIANMAFVTTPGVVGHLKTTPIMAGFPTFLMANGEANGYPVLRTTNVPNDLTKGGGSALHAAIFGNWSDLIIAFWDTIEVIVNPYSKDTEGIIRITVQHESDMQVRRAQSFAICNEIDVA